MFSNPGSDLLAAYLALHPDHSVETVHVSDWDEFDRLLSAAIRARRKLTADELASVGATDGDQGGTFLV